MPHRFAATAPARGHVRHSKFEWSTPSVHIDPSPPNMLAWEILECSSLPPPKHTVAFLLCIAGLSAKSGHWLLNLLLSTLSLYTCHLRTKPPMQPHVSVIQLMSQQCVWSTQSTPQVQPFSWMARHMGSLSCGRWSLALVASVLM